MGTWLQHYLETLIDHPKLALVNRGNFSSTPKTLSGNLTWILHSSKYNISYFINNYYVLLIFFIFLILDIIFYGHFIQAIVIPKSI